MSQQKWHSLPTGLPRPEDDGACSHLPETDFPSVSLTSTTDKQVDPSKLTGLNVMFCYPRTAAPNETVPDDWNAIPGARGCTPQACSFRDASKQFTEYGVSRIFGVSTQDTKYQREVKERLHLPYDLLSDEQLQLTKALRLPTFEWQGKQLIKRLTLIVQDGKVLHVFYPVFPPDRSAEEVLSWLKSR